MSESEVGDYPGQRLGLPLDGSGAVAGYGRRIAALVVDWVVAMLLASLVVGDVWSAEGIGLWAPLIALFIELSVLDGLLGSSIGRRLLSIAVIRVDGKRPVGIARAMLRSALLCLAIPAVVLDHDRRGWHDIAAGTVVVRA